MPVIVMCLRFHILDTSCRSEWMLQLPSIQLPYLETPYGNQHNGMVTQV